ncbi:MAG: Mrp/NBP35 family ATP-binding protein [Firmicutes bacterium]|nr:Mrp/NBP35 family ATP-binding protein [Bacillota bacterium]
MEENCSQNDCASCGEQCEKAGIQKEKLNEFSSVKKVIGVVSGKGGVGKSLVTAMLAVNMRKRGYKTAILDADITGPSIPKIFGINELVLSTEMGLIPLASKSGIDIMSINLLMPDETEPVIWRGPVISGAVTQFWTDVIWEDVDYMFVDMPPGTGDVPLTVFQSLPIDGIIVVTSPQDLVSMIVEKAVKMANMMNVPVLGTVQNMAYFKCPDCGAVHYPFGNGGANVIAERYGIKASAELPIDSELSAMCDSGRADDLKTDYVDAVADSIEKL